MGYRDKINEFIRESNLEGLLLKSAEFHGHICSFSAYGVKAGYYAMKKLALSNEGMEEVLAVIETNNCFSDGIQLITGCTFGNNALIFNDLGKTAVTVINRASGKSVRLALKKSFWESRGEVYPEVFELYDRIVTRRETVSRDQREKFRQLAEKMARQELEIPEQEIFDIRESTTEPPCFAPIHRSVACSLCGESVMETRGRIRDGKPVCIACAGDRYFYMDGFGIGYRG